MAEQAERNGAAPLPVGSVVGILGGGQLGRMTAIAANRLGFVTAVLSPRPEDPAASVAHHHICTSFDDEKGLAKLAELSDVVTYELEQLPAKIETLERQVAALQDTISSSGFYSGAPGEVASTLQQLADTEAQLEAAIERWMELEEQAGQ